jgi:hypothetical protein
MGWGFRPILTSGSVELVTPSPHWLTPSPSSFWAVFKQLPRNVVSCHSQDVVTVSLLMFIQFIFCADKIYLALHSASDPACKNNFLPKHLHGKPLSTDRF